MSVNIGYSVDIKEFRYMFSYREEERINENYMDRQFYDFFILRKNDLKIEEIRVQESEVEQVKFVDMSELNSMVEKGEVVERTAVYQELMSYLFRV